LAWANAPLAKVVAMTNASNCFFMVSSGWVEKINGLWQK